MNRTFTAFLFLLFTTSIAIAQTHTLDLSKSGLQVRNRSFYISKVIDSRIVNSSVGVVQKGLVNNKATAVLPRPLVNELYSYFSLYLPKQAGQFPVMLRVNKFWISEYTTSNTESGTAEVRLDFIYKQDSLYYLLYSTTSLKTRHGLDVTNKHEENIAAALTQSLQEFANRDFNTMLSQAVQLTLEQVNQRYDEAAAAPVFPIMTTSSYVSGVYLSLDEFRSNSPGITSGYEIKERSGFDKVMMGGGSFMPVMYTPEGKEKPMRGAWGFCDGKNLYMNVNGGFVPLALVDNKFSLIGPTANSNVSTATALGAATGGLVGAAVAGGIAAATNKQSLYTLNLETGSLEMDGVPLGMNSKPAKLFLYREQKNEVPEAVTVKVNGVTYTLEANQMVELNLPTATAGTSICLDGANNSCLNFMPSAGEVYYIACTLDKRNVNARPEVRQVDKALGEYSVKGVKFAQIKAEKKKNKSK